MVLSFAACSNDDEGAALQVYTIGDVGPAGGYIFYVDEDEDFEDWTYLEAAEHNVLNNAGTTSNNYVWALPRLSPFTRAAIGTGLSNTLAIVNAVEDQSTRAANAANNFESNGYNDWFLPSRNELTALYNAAPEDKSEWKFESNSYWSSTGSGVDYTWCRSFPGGSETEWRQDYSFFVRPIRRF